MFLIAVALQASAAPLGDAQQAPSGEVTSADSAYAEVETTKEIKDIDTTEYAILPLPAETCSHDPSALIIMRCVNYEVRYPRTGVAGAIGPVGSGLHSLVSNRPSLYVTTTKTDYVPAYLGPYKGLRVGLSGSSSFHYIRSDNFRALNSDSSRVVAQGTFGPFPDRGIIKVRKAAEYHLIVKCGAELMSVQWSVPNNETLDEAVIKCP